VKDGEYFLPHMAAKGALFARLFHAASRSCFKPCGPCRIDYRFPNLGSFGFHSRVFFDRLAAFSASDQAIGRLPAEKAGHHEVNRVAAAVAFGFVGFIGISSEASAGFHGFCHGGASVSSMLMIRSVTFRRKSHLDDGGDSPTGTRLGFADDAMVFSSPLRHVRTQIQVLRFRTLS
jgi:hypothetical protein